MNLIEEYKENKKNVMFSIVENAERQTKASAK